MRLRQPRAAADAVLIGQTGAGKTRFFLEMLDAGPMQPLRIHMPDGSGSFAVRSLRPEAARTLLVGDTPHLTRALQWAELTGASRPQVRARLVDSGGLAHEVHAELSVRRAMVQAIEAALDARCILHAVDAAAVGRSGTIDEVDRAIRSLLVTRPGYAVLATKMDLGWAMAGYLKLRETMRPAPVIPVSAVEKRGIREVRAFVFRTVAVP